MTNNGTFTKKRLSKEWALSLEEENMLGEKRVEEYREKVKEYSRKRAYRANLFGCVMGLYMAIPAMALPVVSYFILCDIAPLSTSLIIGAAAFSTVVIAAGALTSLICRKIKVEGMQNPKDWKAEILNQPPRKEGFFERYVYRIIGNPGEILNQKTPRKESFLESYTSTTKDTLGYSQGAINI